MSERAPSDAPTRSLDVRVGSSTNALQPVAGASRSLAAGVAQWAALGVVATTAIVADQLTKRLVVEELGLGQQIDLVGPFSLHHVRNTGIAFGLFADSTAIVAALTGVAVVAMLWFFAHAGRRHPLLPVSLGLLLGGSLSNFVDRVRLGYVTDFLDLDYWPAFNLADTFIVTGVVLLFVSFVAADRSSPRVGAAPLSRP